MSRVLTVVLVSLLGAILLIPCTASAYNILAVDMGGYWNRLDWQLNRPGETDVVREGYGTPGQTGERWYTMVDHQALATVNLMDYDVLLVQSAFTDDQVTQESVAALSALSGRASDVQDFVSAGRGLVSWTQPFPDGTSHVWDWAPVHLETTGIFHGQPVEIVDGAHPVMEHSTDASLSNWDTSWHGYFNSWDSRLSILAQSGLSTQWPDASYQPITMAGAYNPGGCGRMVFSMQDADYHSYQGKDGARTFILDALDWSVCHPPVPEPSSLALLLGGFGALAAGAFVRRRRG